jgi:hypothetical protein
MSEEAHDALLSIELSSTMLLNAIAAVFPDMQYIKGNSGS